MTLSQLSRAQSLFADFKGSLSAIRRFAKALLIARQGVLRVCELRDRERRKFTFFGARGNFLSFFFSKKRGA
jgi:hypothetical protein